MDAKEGRGMELERIKDLREENFWNQKYVASKLNISQRAYSYYENGQRTIPIDVLCAIATLYEVSTDYLLNRTDIRKPYSNEK